MSKKAKMIQKFYNDGRWNKEMVHNAVNREYGITPEEYEEITGEMYVEAN